MSEFTKRAMKIGTFTLILGIFCSFSPAIYMLVRYGVWPGVSGIQSILAIVIAFNGVSWIVQPVSYFPVLGVSGTYMTWLAGSAADLRVPCSLIAQDIVGVEPGTEKGDAVSTIGICVSILVSFSILTFLVLGGAQIIALLPSVATDAFIYILPALIGALYTQLIMTEFKVGLATLVIGWPLAYIMQITGIDGAFIMLLLVIISILATIVLFNRKHEKEAA